MKVLGISSSPNKKGFTDQLLEKALEGARKEGALTEKIILNDLDFRPCQECGGCDKAGKCVLNDDMQSIYKKIEEADLFIIASPIFFGTITAQLKAMIDRCQSLWVSKYVLKKNTWQEKKRKGIFLCAGGRGAADHFENAKKIIKIIFNVLDIKYSDELFAPGLNKIPADSPERKKYLFRAYELGQSLVKR